MAGRGKNEVTLTFAGDTDALERANKQAQSSTKTLAQAFDDVSAAAKRTDQAVAGIDASASRMSSFAGRGGADLRAYRSDLDGVGDGFNDLEDRAMGAGNLINGFQDVMKGGSQGTASFAMGLSDLAAGTRYTLVPSLQDGVKGAKGFIDRMRQGGGIAAAFKRNINGVGLAAAGITAAVTGAAVAFEKWRSSRMQETVAELSREFRGASGSADAMADVFKKAMDKGPAEVLGSFKSLLETSPQVAQEFINAGNAAGYSEPIMARLQETLNETVTAEEQTAGATSEANVELERQTEAAKAAEEAVRGFYSAQQAAVSPLFAYADAVRNNQEALASEVEAQTDLNTAIAEHGPNSAEAIAAQRDLDAAHQDVIASALTLTETQGELDAAYQDGRITAEELDAILGQLKASGYNSGAAMQYLGGLISALQSRTVTVAVRDEASGAIESIKSRLTGLTLSYSIPVRVAGNPQQSFGGRQAGGGVAPYFGSGGVNWNWGMGPRGTDTVPAMLTPGEMVLNRGQQANLFRLINGGVGGGGGTIRLVIDSGSNPVDRMMADMLRRIVRVEHGGDVQAALGYSR